MLVVTPSGLGNAGKSARKRVRRVVARRVPNSACMCKLRKNADPSAMAGMGDMGSWLSKAVGGIFGKKSEPTPPAAPGGAAPGANDATQGGNTWLRDIRDIIDVINRPALQLPANPPFQLPTQPAPAAPAPPPAAKPSIDTNTLLAIGGGVVGLGLIAILATRRR